jgi:hypothetical protein
MTEAESAVTVYNTNNPSKEDPAVIRKQDAVKCRC